MVEPESLPLWLPKRHLTRLSGATFEMYWVDMVLALNFCVGCNYFTKSPQLVYGLMVGSPSGFHCGVARARGAPSPFLPWRWNRWPSYL